MTNLVYRSIFFIIMFCLLIFGESIAQSNWINDKTPFSAKIECFGAKFRNYNRQNIVQIQRNLSGYGGFLSVKKIIRSSYWLKLEMPFAQTNYKYSRPYVNINYNQTEIGIPYFGIEILDNDSRVLNEIGIRYRFRAEPENDAFAGMYSDYYRFEAFMNLYSSLKWTISFMHENQNLIRWRFNMGSLVFVPHSKDSDIGVELFGTYGSDLLIKSRRVDACFGISGITHLTDNGFRTDNTDVLIGFGPNFKFKRLNCGLRMNFPLGLNLINILDFAVGAYLQVGIIN